MLYLTYIGFYYIFYCFPDFYVILDYFSALRNNLKKNWRSQDSNPGWPGSWYEGKGATTRPSDRSCQHRGALRFVIAERRARRTGGSVRHGYVALGT